MTTFQIPGPTLDVDAQSSTTPLIVLFERDDSIAVPLLSQIRLAGYDVRAARTPVELFDITGKQLVALILIDMGSATAGRREFWVALDTQRRGRSIQIMTFRYTMPGGYLDSDFEPSARAIADVEVRGAHEFQLIIEGLLQRVPLHSVSPAAMNVFTSPPRVVDADLPPGGIAPIGAALGIPSPFMMQPPVPFGATASAAALESPALYGVAAEVSSPFAHPAASNPFIQTSEVSSTSLPEENASPFATPYSSNPFGAGTTSTALPAASAPAYAFSYQAPTNAPTGSFEARAAQLSDAYAAEFGIGDTPPLLAGLTSVGNGIGKRPPSVDDFIDASLAGSGADPSSRRLPVGTKGADYAFSDAWTPPEADEIEVQVFSPAPRERHDLSGVAAAAFTPTEYAPALSPEMVSRGRGDGRGVLDPSTLQTAEISLPPVPPSPPKAPAKPVSPQEESLGSVLVEGALLSEKRLETLQGVQHMLSDVQVDVKLGELALLFKFLSRDQLLAAELVSRGLVSPQQIANLGRTKQDLASSGMEYNLADLLTMFDVLPEEQVRQICKEITP